MPTTGEHNGWNKGNVLSLEYRRLEKKGRKKERLKERARRKNKQWEKRHIKYKTKGK